MHIHIYWCCLLNLINSQFISKIKKCNFTNNFIQNLPNYFPKISWDGAIFSEVAFNLIEDCFFKDSNAIYGGDIFLRKTEGWKVNRLLFSKKTHNQKSSNIEYIREKL